MTMSVRERAGYRIVNIVEPPGQNRIFQPVEHAWPAAIRAMPNNADRALQVHQY
jgi:hypothetical protein